MRWAAKRSLQLLWIEPIRGDAQCVTCPINLRDLLTVNVDMPVDNCANNSGRPLLASVHAPAIISGSNLMATDPLFLPSAHQYLALNSRRGLISTTEQFARACSIAKAKS